MAIEVKNASGWGSDITAEAPVSSVGAIVWPPVEASEQRKKGILTPVIETPQDAAQILEGFASTDFGTNKSGEPITRISGRIFLANSVFAGMDEVGQQMLGQLTEAVIPLSGTGIDALEDVSLVYLGMNQEERRTSGHIIEAETAMARQTFANTQPVASRNYSDYEFRTLNEGDRNDPNLQIEYAALYSAFGWSEEDVVKMLTNPTNTLMAVFGNTPGEPRGPLASAVIAESVVLPVVREGKEYPLHMAEITEAITTPEHRGNGLYTELAIRLMEHLAQGDVNLIYGESNALRVKDRTGQTRQPVLSSVAKLGRQSSLQAMDALGLPPRLLEQHVRISMGPEDARPDSEKNDLLVTFMPRSSLIERYGTQNR